mmetsp:Transcript_37219/g.119158  ORF Transcript_37219/g.119158 Transcript_37219/m.119158 type:complete len:98 (-) Transcript_37219:71-364(-)
MQFCLLPGPTTTIEMQAIATFCGCHDELQDCLTSDDSFVRPQHPQWHHKVFINVLRDAYMKIHPLLPAFDPVPRVVQAQVHRLHRLRATEECGLRRP